MINDDAFGGWALDRPVFDWILENISEGSTILELGSGPSTVELCKFYNVCSIENNRKWMNKTRSNYIHAPIVNYNDEHGEYQWYDIDILKEKLPKYYDLLIIDGPSANSRIPFLYNLELFHTKIPFIVDDTNKANKLFLCEELKRVLSKNEIWRFGNSEKECIIIE